MPIPDLNIPFKFVPDTLADADQVNANLQFVAKLTGYFFPQNYGAVGDGITNDGPALQAALDAANANGGGTVLLGPYTYLSNQVLFINGSDVNLQGQGQGTSIIQQGFVSNSSNYALLVASSSSNSCEISHFTLHNPLASAAIGAIPGPTTLIAPAVGYGWAFLNFGGSANKVEFVTASGFFHGLGGIIFSNGLSFQNCSINMGGNQQSGSQYAMYAQGRAGTDATGTFSVGGTPTNGDTVDFVFDDGQGNVIDTGAYTLTGGDGGSVNHTAISLAQFINDSAAVTGSNANWNQASASGPNVTVSIQIPPPTVPPTTTTPTYKATNTGNVVVSPTVTTQVTGGSASGNPQSFPFSIKDCSVAQAGFQPTKPGPTFQATEAVHIDGGVQSWSVKGIGTTGCFYGVRVVNQNSGNNRNSSLCSISEFSFDHTSISAISLESGSGCDVHDGGIIANFGGGPPAVNFAVLVAPTYVGGAKLHDFDITNCSSGGIGIGAQCIVENCHIVAVGKGSQSCINLLGTTPIVGVKIMGNKLGTPSVAATGVGTQKFAIDLAGSGSETFTSTVQSLTILGNDCQGRGGPINIGTIMANSFAATGANTFLIIQGNPGLNPLTDAISGVAQPTIPAANAALPAVNNFGCDAVIVINPNGATISSIQIMGQNGTTTKAVNTTAQLTVTCPAGASILPVYGSGSPSWLWFYT